MACEGKGWWASTTTLAEPGALYRYVVDGTAFPDPASRRQPDGVHGPSEVIDPETYEWSDQRWCERRWEEIVLYELHVGAFSETGDFSGVARHLDHLCRLGVTAVELMPIAEFAGARNWGYDGVFAYAPSSHYGRPEALKRLVEDCHARGSGGPARRRLQSFWSRGGIICRRSRRISLPGATRPRGEPRSIFPGPKAGQCAIFFIHNALYWLEEFQFDGLRLDAVHAIFDDSQPDIVDEICQTVRRRIPDREIHLVLENDRNEARRLSGTKRRGRRCTAQWNDDLHHALHVLLTGEKSGFYADYADAPARHLGRALAEGFAYQGEPSPYRDARPRGEPSAHLPATAFIAFLQNHDHVGNHPFGTRLSARAHGPALRAGIAIVLLSPQIPLLFMGEEWASRRPFAFFCDFGPDLAAAVREGRRREFAHFSEFQNENARAQIPTRPPRRPSRCRGSIGPSRSRRTMQAGSRCTAHFSSSRTREIVPRLAGIPPNAGHYQVTGPQAVNVEWRLGDGSRLLLVANFSAQAVPVPGPQSTGRLIYSSAAPGAPDQRQLLSVGSGPLGDMTDRTALVRLAALIGIETGYTDALGQTREASDEALLALIDAFGFTDPAQAASELEERRRAVPLGLGPAHIVHAEAARPELTLRLPAGTREIAWDLPSRRRRRASGQRGGRNRSRGRGFRPAAAGGLADRLSPAGARSRRHCSSARSDRGPGQLPSAAAARTGRAQLGADLPTLWAAQRP